MHVIETSQNVTDRDRRSPLKIFASGGLANHGGQDFAEGVALGRLINP